VDSQPKIPYDDFYALSLFPPMSDFPDLYLKSSGTFSLWTLIFAENDDQQASSISFRHTCLLSLILFLSAFSAS